MPFYFSYFDNDILFIHSFSFICFRLCFSFRFGTKSGTQNPRCFAVAERGGGGDRVTGSISEHHSLRSQHRAVTRVQTSTAQTRIFFVFKLSELFIG